ncbi:MAG: DNA polymerase I [Planctomycetes bacterium]|nr:DNA polymerase I [Planctomycetota bacterium]
MPDRLVLVDAPNFIFRAFHALPPLTSPAGEPTGAVYGFVQMLQKLLRDTKPTHLAVVFDPPGKTFRDEAYAEYKATRSETPPELVAQFGPIRELVQAWRAPLLEVAGFEADDVIGTLARRGREAGLEVLIATGDKDLCQVVTEGVKLIDTMKDRISGPAEVVEKFGVPPGRVVDVLALMGDSVDNVPGVPGVGGKTATALVQHGGSVEALLENPDLAGKPRWAQLLREHAASARLSKMLVTIRTDVPVPGGLDDLRVRPADAAALRAMFARFGFNRLLKDLPAGESALPRAGYRTVDTIEGVRELALRLASPAGSALSERSESKGFAFSTLATSRDGMRAAIVGLAFSTGDGDGAYVPLGHSPMLAPRQPARDAALAVLAPVFADPAVPKSAWDAKFDLLLLARHGVPVAGLACDPMLAAYVLDPGRPNDLESLAAEHLASRLTPAADIAGRGRAQVSFDNVDVPSATAAACEAADAAGRLARTLPPKLETNGLTPLFRDVEMPLLEVLFRMERTGIRVDAACLGGLAEEFGKRLKTLQDAVFEAAGESFNIDSTKQLQRVLFEKLKLSPGRKTKTGYSTDAAVLEKLAAEHPVPARIVEFRTLAKLKSTYVDALPQAINPETGRIHTTFSQAVAATGRLSSNDPNLQNIPIRTEEGRRIRRAFVTEPGWILLSADYSQIELRLLAHASGDAALVDAYRGGKDVHARTAAEVFGVAEELVTDDMRRAAKVVNFGVIYGMGAGGLAQSLGIDRAAAARYIDAYFRRYAGVRAFLDRTLEETRRTGYVRTLLGRRRPLPDINSASGPARAAAERMAVNAPVQGSAADLIKVAMIRADRGLREKRLRSRMLLQVHDELVFEGPEGEREELRALAVEAMEGAMVLEVPLKVEVASGRNWGELE